MRARRIAGAFTVTEGAPTDATRSFEVLRTDPDLALYGRYLVSRRLREEGFEFRFPELGGALGDLLAR